MNNTKYLEYYMDSKVYSKDEVQKSIDETKKEFSNRQIDVQVHLNKFGVYIITFTFNKKNSFIKAIYFSQKMIFNCIMENMTHGINAFFRIRNKGFWGNKSLVSF